MLTNKIKLCLIFLICKLFCFGLICLNEFVFTLFPFSHCMFNLFLSISNEFFLFQEVHYLYMSLWEGLMNGYE